MGSVIFVRRGARQELVGGIDYESEPVGWFWFTYAQNTCRVPARNTRGESVEYPTSKACADASRPVHPGAPVKARPAKPGPKVSQLDVARLGIVEDLIRAARSVNELEERVARLTEETTIAKADLIEARNALRAVTFELANHDRRRSAEP